MKRACSLLLLLILVAGCGTPTPFVPPTAGPAGIAETVAPPSPTPAGPTPLPTLDFSTAESVGRGFLSAWEAGDYGAMYALLTPAQREGLAQSEFEQAYRTPLNTTTTISVTNAPHTLQIEGDLAWIEFRQVWHTGLFGELRANNRLPLERIGEDWWVVWNRAVIWPDFADGKSFGVDYQIPPRANIYDRNGAGLAVPTTIVTVGVVPNEIQDEPAVVTVLSQVLGRTEDQVRRAFAGQPAHWFIPIGEITAEQRAVHQASLARPGITLRERTGRAYPLDGVGAHVVGWVSPIPAERYQDYRLRGYRGDEWVGIAGLEAWAESILAGRNGGRLFMVNADGSFAGALADRRPERGRAIYTTLDRELQRAAEQALGGRRGAVVALDVHTGAVLALTSGPTFDNNIFVRPAEDVRRAAVLNDPNLPLLNRALQGLYPTGSVFKIVTMAAGLSTAGMQATTPFNCPGHWDGLGVGNRKTCWLSTGHGAIDLADGLTASCNVVYYEVGMRLNAIDPGALSTIALGFGLGQRTGLQELPEAEGLIPTPDWKLERYQMPWAAGDTVNLAIGQGFLQVTPIQVARAVAAVANGGTLYRTYLVDRIGESPTAPEQSFTPRAVGRLPVSDDVLATIRAAMLAVTTNAQIGTATHRFAGLDIPVAGKTGTAQTGRAGEAPHSWFAGYFPADNPQIAMVVIVENAGEGSTVAAPMFRQIVEGYYGREITPLPTPPPAPEGD